MHDMLIDMAVVRLQVDGVRITCPYDRREHVVDEQVFASSVTGHWPARCGALVVSADLGTPPGRPCRACRGDRR